MISPGEVSCSWHTGRQEVRTTNNCLSMAYRFRSKQALRKRFIVGGGLVLLSVSIAATCSFIHSQRVSARARARVALDQEAQFHQNVLELSTTFGSKMRYQPPSTSPTSAQPGSVSQHLAGGPPASPAFMAADEQARMRQAMFSARGSLDWSGMNRGRDLIKWAGHGR